MDDITDAEATDAQGVAFFVTDWLTDFHDLTDALVLLRELRDATGAIDLLLEVPHVRRLRDVWENWEQSADLEAEEADIALERFLREDEIARLRFAVWGTGPNPLRQL